MIRRSLHQRGISRNAVFQENQPRSTRRRTIPRASWTREGTRTKRSDLLDHGPPHHYFFFAVFFFLAVFFFAAFFFATVSPHQKKNLVKRLTSTTAVSGHPDARRSCALFTENRNRTASRRVDPRLHRTLEAGRRSTIGIALRGAHVLYLYGFRKIVQDDFCRPRSNRRACAAREVPMRSLDQRRQRALLMRGAREHHYEIKPSRFVSSCTTFTWRSRLAPAQRDDVHGQILREIRRFRDIARPSTRLISSRARSAWTHCDAEYAASDESTRHRPKSARVITSRDGPMGPSISAKKILPPAKKPT